MSKYVFLNIDGTEKNSLKETTMNIVMWQTTFVLKKKNVNSLFFISMSNDMTETHKHKFLSRIFL